MCCERLPGMRNEVVRLHDFVMEGMIDSNDASVKALNPKARPCCMMSDTGAPLGFKALRL